MNAFIGGFVQFFVPTHLLAVIALGFMGAQYARLVVMVPAFAAGLIVGLVAIAIGIGETPATLALLMLAAIAAAFVAAQVRSGRIVALLAVAVGVALPLNSPPHEITIANAIASQAGFAIAALITLLLVALVTTHATAPWQRVGVRIVASWIAASAILVLALRLAR